MKIEDADIDNATRLDPYLTGHNGNSLRRCYAPFQVSSGTIIERGYIKPSKTRTG
jgi:hypothetical protein